LTSFSTAGDQVLDQFVEQGYARSLIDELVQPEHCVLIQATGVERLDQRLTHVACNGQVELFGPRRILGEPAADPVDRRAEVQFD
jgi:hypothetical protein